MVEFGERPEIELAGPLKDLKKKLWGEWLVIEITRLGHHQPTEGIIIAHHERKDVCLQQANEVFSTKGFIPRVFVRRGTRIVNVPNRG